MPYDNNGDYTLPEAPFENGTTADANPLNTDLSDIATALNEVVTRNGTSKLTGPLILPSGSTSTPALAFNSDPTVGMHLVTTGEGSLDATNVSTLTWTSTGITANVPLTTTALSAGTLTITGVAGQSTTSALTIPVGTTGQRPSNVTGDIRFNSSTSQFEGYDGGGWVAFSGLNAIEFVIDGGGAAILSGVKGYLEVPYNFTIQRATLLADQVGSIKVDVWSTPFVSFPPTSGNSITASDTPTLSNAIAEQDVALTGWTTLIPAGNIIAFNVVSNATNISKVTISLAGKKS